MIYKINQVSLSFGITSVLPSEAHKKRKNTVFAHRILYVNKLKNFNIFINANAWTELTMLENKTRNIR